MKKLFNKISDWWWLYVGYPMYMSKLERKIKKDLIDSTFLDDID